MYHDLDTFLILALVEINHGPKAMYKKAVEMYRGKVKVKPEVAQGIIRKSIKDRDIKTVSYKINAYIEDYLYYALPAKEAGKVGAQGLVIYEGHAHPIVVTYETEEDYWWVLENETEIYTAASFWLVWNYRLTQDFSGDFLMFASYGFKGQPRYWGIKNIGGPIAYKDLLYYPGEGETTEGTYTHNELAEKQAMAKRALIEQA